MDKQFVGNRGCEQVARGNPLMGLGLPADYVIPFILGIIDKFTALLIYPVIGDDTVSRGVRACGQ